jgi:hypothetical protein
MSHHHRVGQSADLINLAPTTDFFNTIGQQRTFPTAGVIWPNQLSGGRPAQSWVVTRPMSVAVLFESSASPEIMESGIC